MLHKVTHCSGRVSANTRPHQLMISVESTWKRMNKHHDLRMDLCVFESVVRGHHIYKEVWTLRTEDQVACGNCIVEIH